MERDVKRYECNVTLRETEQRTECKGERRKEEIGIVHSTEFIQPNAGRCMFTRNTAAVAAAAILNVVVI